jgi:predicted tellurium resistance membrane protein TerC
MLTLLSDPDTWISLLTLTVMEVVLGIDNVVFISVLVSKLPPESAGTARRIGLALALVARVLLLLVISWIIGLTQPVISAAGLDLSWRDLILLAGGVFLIYKATREMHAEIEEPQGHGMPRAARAAFSTIIMQIVLIDLVFSIDSIITAVGMAQHVEVMIAAVIIAVGLMYVGSGPIAGFIAAHPTTKMLALAFLLMVGISLSADGLGFHIPREYIYSAMGFSVLVEAINILAHDRRRKAALAAAAEPAAMPAAEPPETGLPTPKPKTTPMRRAQSRPKSAPRKART